MEQKDGIGIIANGAIATAVLTVLAACSAHGSTSTTANVPSAARAVDPARAPDPAPTRESEAAQDSQLPEVVVTARAPHPSRLARAQVPRKERLYEQQRYE